MPLDTSAVYDIAANMLASVADRLADAGLTVPDRQYVHGGDIAHDCEQLVVAVTDLVHAFPGEAAAVQFCSPPRHARFAVSLVRCVPVPQDDGTPPTAEALDDAGAVTAADVWSLAYVLWAGYQAGEWGAACSTLLLGPVAVVGPEGGMVAVTAEVFLLIT